MSEQLLVRFTKWNRSREMYSPMQLNARKPQHSSAFAKKKTSSDVRREREPTKEEDRQGADVK